MSATHTLIEAAARGEPPAWAQVGPRRFAHMQRVSALLGEWSAALGLADVDRVRWRAVGLLHDALRQAPPTVLRPLVPPAQRDIEPKLLHGPAAAERLRRDGIADEPLLHAIAHHTLGDADLDTMGCALFLADFLEPGRRYHPLLLASLRARMPARLDDVLVDVLRFRINRMITDAKPIRPQTAAFWNAAVRNAGSAANSTADAAPQPR